MNPRTLPVKRRPVSNGFFKRIHAVTRHRNQRVATTTADDLENDGHSARISRGFTIIFLIHVVAIALYFIHLNFLNDHSVAKATPPAAAASPKPRTDNPPMLGPDYATGIVVAGDTYARIAAREGVDETALRAANQNKPIAAGRTFILPPKRIAAKDSAMVVALRKQDPLSAEHGMLEEPPVDPSAPLRRLLVHPGVVHEVAAPKAAKDIPTVKTSKDTAKTTKDTSKSSKDTTKTSKDTPKSSKDTAKSSKDTAKSSKDTAKATKDTAKTSKDTAKTAKDTSKATPAASKQSYTVKSGDNLYRIAKRYKIDQSSLMRANNISDPAKLNSGMTLVIPH